MAQKIKIRLVRSTIGSLPKQRATIRSLGLGKIGSSVYQEATPVILGMIRVVSHMVSVTSEAPASVTNKDSGKGVN